MGNKESQLGRASRPTSSSSVPGQSSGPVCPLGCGRPPGKNVVGFCTQCYEAHVAPQLAASSETTQGVDGSSASNPAISSQVDGSTRRNSHTTVHREDARITSSDPQYGYPTSRSTERLHYPSSTLEYPSASSQSPITYPSTAKSSTGETPGNVYPMPGYPAMAVLEKPEPVSWYPSPATTSSQDMSNSRVSSSSAYKYPSTAKSSTGETFGNVHPTPGYPATAMLEKPNTLTKYQIPFPTKYPSTAKSSTGETFGNVHPMPPHKTVHRDPMLNYPTAYSSSTVGYPSVPSQPPIAYPSNAGSSNEKTPGNYSAYPAYPGTAATKEPAPVSGYPFPKTTSSLHMSNSEVSLHSGYSGSAATQKPAPVSGYPFPTATSSLHTSNSKVLSNSGHPGSSSGKHGATPQGPATLLDAPVPKPRAKHRNPTSTVSGQQVNVQPSTGTSSTPSVRLGHPSNPANLGGTHGATGKPQPSLRKDLTQLNMATTGVPVAEPRGRPKEPSTAPKTPKTLARVVQPSTGTSSTPSVRLGHSSNPANLGGTHGATSKPQPSLRKDLTQLYMATTGVPVAEPRGRPEEPSTAPKASKTSARVALAHAPDMTKSPAPSATPVYPSAISETARGPSPNTHAPLSRLAGPEAHAAKYSYSGDNFAAAYGYTGVVERGSTHSGSSTSNQTPVMKGSGRSSMGSSGPLVSPDGANSYSSASPRPTQTPGELNTAGAVSGVGLELFGDVSSEEEDDLISLAMALEHQQSRAATLEQPSPGGARPKLQASQKLDRPLMEKLVEQLPLLDLSYLREMLGLSEEEVVIHCPRSMKDDTPLAVLVCWKRKLVRDGSGEKECIDRLAGIMELYGQEDAVAILRGTSVAQHRRIERTSPQQPLVDPPPISRQEPSTESAGATVNIEPTVGDHGTTADEDAPLATSPSPEPIVEVKTPSIKKSEKEDVASSKPSSRQLGSHRQVKGIRETLMCPIHLDLLENAKTLPCQHVICEECLDDWVKSHGALTCPSCNVTHKLPAGGVAKLPNNFVVNSLVDELKKFRDDDGEDMGEQVVGDETIAEGVQSHDTVAAGALVLPRDLQHASTPPLMGSNHKDVAGGSSQDIRREILPLIDSEDRGATGGSSQDIRKAIPSRPDVKAKNATVGSSHVIRKAIPPLMDFDIKGATGGSSQDIRKAIPSLIESDGESAASGIFSNIASDGSDGDETLSIASSSVSDLHRGQQGSNAGPCAPERAPDAANSTVMKMGKNFVGKGGKVKLTIKLYDSQGRRVRSWYRDRIEASVTTPKGEQVSISCVTWKKRGGDYWMNFASETIGIHVFEVRFDEEQIGGSPLKVVVRPSNKLVDQWYVGGVYHSYMLKGGVTTFDGDYVAVDNSRCLTIDTCSHQDEWGKLPGDSVSLYGIASFTTRVFLTNSANGCVSVMKNREFSTNFGKRILKTPTGIVIDRAGVIYVADSATNRIEMFRPNFSHTGSIELDGLSDQSSLAMLALNQAQDRIIVADAGSNTIIICSIASTKVVKRFKTRINQTPVSPFGILVDSEDNIFVSVTSALDKSQRNRRHKEGEDEQLEGAVVVYNTNGYFLGTIGKNTLTYPKGMCWSPDEPSRLVVVDVTDEEESSLMFY